MKKYLFLTFAVLIPVVVFFVFPAGFTVKAEFFGEPVLANVGATAVSERDASELPNFQDDIQSNISILGEDNSKCKDMLVEVFAKTPSYLLKKLSSVEIESKSNFRGSGTEDSIKINCSLDQSQFTYTFFHELGHVLYHMIVANNFDGIYENIENPFAKTAPKYNEEGAPNFLTEYATTNEHEDFAESFAIYMTQPELFRRKTINSAILRGKYEFIKQIQNYDRIDL